MKRMFEVKLITPKDVSEFASAASNCPASIKVLASHGEFVVDAKSIMWLYSLNLSQPITIEISSDLDIDINTYFAFFEKWISNT